MDGWDGATTLTVTGRAPAFFRSVRSCSCAWLCELDARAPGGVDLAAADTDRDSAALSPPARAPRCLLRGAGRSPAGGVVEGGEVPVGEERVAGGVGAQRRPDEAEPATVLQFSGRS